MRKIIFTLFVCLVITITGFAQVNKNAWLMGGDLSLNTSTWRAIQPDTIPSKTERLTVTPKIGWFVSKSVVVGLAPSYSYWNSKNYYFTGVPNYYPDKQKGSSVAITPFVRYYKALGDKWMLFGEFDGISVFSQKQEDQNSQSFIETRSQGYQIGLFVRPGITYLLSSKVGLEVSLGSLGYGFTHQKRRYQDQETGTTLEYSVNSSNGGLNLSAALSQLAVGVQFYLGGTK